MESRDSVRIGGINDVHVLLSLCLAVLVVLQHQLSLLRVPAGTGSQELCSPIKPNPLPEHTQGKTDSTPGGHTDPAVGAAPPPPKRDP